MIGDPFGESNYKDGNDDFDDDDERARWSPGGCGGLVIPSDESNYRAPHSL